MGGGETARERERGGGGGKRNGERDRERERESYVTSPLSVFGVTRINTVTARRIKTAKTTDL